MTALRVYRDDGFLADWLGRRLAATGVRAGATAPLAWVVPPLIRLVEYGGLIALTAAAEPDALPVCFALLGVLAFRHYDAVYRLRHQRLAPPAWLRLAAGGWEGRLLAASVLALTGTLTVGLAAAAAALALASVTESVLSWARFGRRPGTSALPDDDDVDAD